MFRHQPIFTFSLLRALTHIFLVRVYVVTALILPALATATLTPPAHAFASQADSSLANSLDSLPDNSAVLMGENPRIDILTQAIEQQPENAPLYNSRGWYSFLDGNYEQAVNDYSQVIALGIETLDPVYHTSVYHVRGLAYAELGETELAIDSLQVAAQLYRSQDNAAGAQEVEAAIEQLSVPKAN